MAASSPITRQTVGKTFIVASSFLGLVAIVQVSAITWAFVVRFREASTKPRAVAQQVTPIIQPRLRPAPLPESNNGLDLTGPDLAMLAATTPSAAEPAPTGPITPPPKPMPLAPGKSSGVVPQTRFEELIEQGRMLRERGDNSGALLRLREAQLVDSANPLAIYEIARTYERMGLQEKASEQWKRIYEMGEAAGSYFVAADARLKQSQTMAILQAQQNPETAADAPVSSTNAGAVLGIGIITMDELTDEESERKFILRVPLKKRPQSSVEVRDVVIQVLFYDFVDNKDVIQTNANVNSRWASTPPDWSDGDTEVLEVEYQQPRKETTEGTKENRKYFGYIVRLYYKDDLQDTRADPARLGAQFPAPTTLPKESGQ